MINSQFKNVWTRIVIILILNFGLISSGIAQSPLGLKLPAFYEVVGKIESINDTMIKLGDQQLILSPTAKIYLKNNKAGSMKNLLIGTHVGVNTITINKRRLADSIHIIEGTIQ